MRFNLKLLLIVVIWIAAAYPHSRGGAQSVELQIRPRMGDTLRMRLDQKVELLGLMGKDTVMASVSSMQMFTRAIPISFSANGTLLLAIADSISTNPRNNSLVQKSRIMQGQSMQLKISLDGAMRLVDSRSAQSSIRSLFANMPATLPGKPVSIGESWIREMLIASPYEPGTMCNVRTTFMLDSLGQNGDVAYISLRGVIAHALPGGGTDNDMTGSITGAMQVDRRLAWMTDSRATIKIKSMVPRTLPPTASPPGNIQAPSDSMQVKMRITQWLRAQ